MLADPSTEDEHGPTYGKPRERHKGNQRLTPIIRQLEDFGEQRLCCPWFDASVYLRHAGAYELF